MARPAKHPIDVEQEIVSSVLFGESSMAEAARRHGISQTSIGKWREQFLAGGRDGLARGSSADKPTGREARLVEEVDDVTRWGGVPSVRAPAGILSR